MRKAGWALAIFAGTACLPVPTDPNSVVVSGTVHDYVTGNVLPGASISAFDAPSPFSTTSGPDGTYVLGGLPRGAPFMPIAFAPSYRPTRNARHDLDERAMTIILSALTQAEVDRLYGTVGLAPAPATAIVIVSFETPAGQPAEGVLLRGVRFRAFPDTSAGTGIGPFLFDASGDLAPVDSLTETIAIDGRARAAFLDVPPGIYSLSSFPSFRTVLVETSADGATLVRKLH
jgi:hypothetical protein